VRPKQLGKAEIVRQLSISFPVVFTKNTDSSIVKSSAFDVANLKQALEPVLVLSEFIMKRNVPLNEQ